MLKIEKPKIDFSIFDEIKYFPYTEKEYKFAMKMVDMLRKSTLFDFIENPSYERSMFQYFLSRDVADSLSVKVVKLKIYNHNDELFYEEVLSPNSSVSIDGTVELFQHRSMITYPELSRYEMVGWSEKYKQEIQIQHWEGKFFEQSLKNELEGNYGIHRNMKTYKLIENEIKKEISRRIQRYEMSNRAPRSFGRRNIQNDPYGWDRNFE